ncbi:unnamed protein product [Cunninghamella blakesleeana]
MMLKLLRYIEEDESPLTLRGLLSKHYARSVIGRLCSISGSSANVARAWREVLSIAYPKNCDCTRAVIRFLVPIELIKKLKRVSSKSIKNGCILNDIVILSGTYISINPQPIRNTTECVLHLSVRTSSAYLDQYEHALNLLCAQFIKYRKESLSPANIYYTPSIDRQPQIIFDDDDDECNIYIKEQQLKKLYGERKNVYQRNRSMDEINGNQNQYNYNYNYNYNNNNNIDKGNGYYNNYHYNNSNNSNNNNNNNNDYHHHNHNSNNDDDDSNYQQFHEKGYYRNNQSTSSSIASPTFHHSSLPISPPYFSTPTNTHQLINSNSTSTCTSPPFLRKTSSRSTSPLSSASSTPKNPFMVTSSPSSSTQSRFYSNNRKDRQKDSSTIINEEEVASSGWQSFARGRFSNAYFTTSFCINTIYLI